jgi:hypothetical protein
LQGEAVHAQGATEKLKRQQRKTRSTRGDATWPVRCGRPMHTSMQKASGRGARGGENGACRDGLIWLPGVAGLVTLILLAAARLVFMLAATRLAWRSINSHGPCVYA